MPKDTYVHTIIKMNCKKKKTNVKMAVPFGSQRSMLAVHAD